MQTLSPEDVASRSLPSSDSSSLSEPSLGELGSSTVSQQHHHM